MKTSENMVELLGEKVSFYLDHVCKKKILKDELQTPSKNSLDRVFVMGRKAFQKPFGEGVKLLRLVQSVYLDPKFSIE